MKKKTATKKAPAKKKVTRKKVQGYTGGFDIMSKSGREQLVTAKEELARISTIRKTKPTNFGTLAEVQSLFIPVDHFALQYTLGAIGIPMGSVVQLLGGTGLGKSTVGHYILGCAMRHCKGPTLAVHWSGKLFHRNRAVRTLSSSPEQAREMVEVMTHSAVPTLQEMEYTVNDFIRVWREKNKLPRAVPITILVDNASKLLNAEEAQGVVDWSDYMSEKGKKAKKETNTGSNFVHSKWYEAWTRRMGYSLHHNNVTVILVLDQKDSPDMSSGPGGAPKPAIPESTKALFSTTHRGGTAIRQASLMAINFAYAGLIKDPTTKEERGKGITIRVSKNCVGAEGRRIKMELRTDHHRYDRPGYLDPALHFDEALADKFAADGLFATTVNRGRYTSEPLGIIEATSVELSMAFHSRRDLVQELGHNLRIEGYYDLVDRLLIDYATPAPVPEEPTVEGGEN